MGYDVHGTSSILDTQHCRVEVFIPAETWTKFLFYFFSFHAVNVVEFVFSVINLFSCFSQQVCSPFEKEEEEKKGIKYQNLHECGLS